MPKACTFRFLIKGVCAFLLVLLPLFLAHAQQMERMRRQNKLELAQFSRQKSTQWTIEKRKADSLATILKIPISYFEKDSNKIVILQRLGPKNKPVYYATDNISVAATISVDDVWTNNNSYPSLSGEGIEINLWDGGSIRITHQELQNGPGSRVVMRDLGLPLSNHSTHIAGTMIATGVNADAKGMAGKAIIKAWDLNDDIAEMSGAAADGIVLSNHSYGPFCGWSYNSGNESWYWYGDPDISTTEDYEFGFYNQVSADLDYIAQLAPNYLIVKSGGNDRNDVPATQPINHYVWDETWKLVNVVREPDGGTDGYDCLTPMAVAKNILTVGAVDDAKAITLFSAYGPTDDGRVKPDVVSNGFDVFSSTSASDNSYTSYSGTSMSTASATGSVALLHQLQNTLQPGVQLRSSTIKGLLIHTAADLGNTGPDYRFGWGLLNIKEAADLIYANSNNQGKNIFEAVLVNDGEINIPVTTKSAPFLKVTICWTDPAGQASDPSLNSRNKKLVNDLDILVEKSADHQTFMPWILNVENPGAAATRNMNHIDNVEQVYIANPGDNNFNIKIYHSGTLSGGSQSFSLIVTGIETISNIFPPKNLTYTINESSILLSWDSPDSSAPQSYKIYRNGTFLAETVNTTYTDQSIILDNVYEYYITAVYELNNQKYESIETNLVSVFPQTLRPLPFIVDFETELTEVRIKNTETGWRLGDSESLNCYYLNFSDNTTKFIGIDSYSAGEVVHVSDIAVTAPLRLANYSNIVLSFDYLLKTGIYDAIDELHVVYKLQEEQEWHELNNLASSFNWKHESIELPSEMCKNGTQIGFYYDDFYQWGMGAGLDNIQVTGTLTIQEDISLESISSPAATNCFQTIPYDLTISIKNTGNISIPSGQKIQVTSNCNAIQKTNTYTLLQNLAPGGIVQINFQNMINYLPVGMHTLSVEALWQNDQNPSNNIKTKSITINTLPTITFVNPPSKLCISETSVILTANPIDGVFSGPSIVGNIFNPSVAGIGIHNITYTYQDVNTCTNSATTSIEVVPLPVVSFSGLAAQYCANNPPVLLTGNPSGGYFTGDGVLNTQFDPKVAGVGTHLIKYVYTNEYGCSNTAQHETVVLSPSPLIIVGLGPTYCQNDDPIELTGLPEGGIFKIDEKVVDYLIPTQTEIGSLDISYTFLNENGCTSTTSQSINIRALPEVSIIDLDDKYCLNDLDVTLSGIPAGGIFGGSSVDGNVFYPNLAGIGEHELTYTFEDLYGCINSDTITLKVMPLPTVAFTGLSAQYCSNGEASLLVGIPTNGSFSGTGVIGNYFDPKIAGVGIHNIDYQYTDANGCYNTAQHETNILAPAPTTIVGLEEVYCQNDGPIKLSGFPDGGVFYVDGNIADYLIPNQMVAGNVEINYAFLDQNSCTSIASKSVNILALPQVSIIGLNDLYCSINMEIPLMGMPDGGVFSLEGEQIVTFNPTKLGDGVYDISYAYQDEFDCAGSTTKIVTVNSNPTLSISNIKPTYCPNESSVVLTGIPSGGYFEVDGIIEQIMNPSQLMTGDHTISYFYKLNGCEAFTTASIKITETQAISILGLKSEYCPKDSLVNVEGQPPGGLFTIEPVFKESPDNITYSLYYTYTDVNKCTFVDSGNFKILPEPKLSLPSNLTLTLLDTVTFVMEQENQYYIWPNDSTSTAIQFIGASMPNGENLIPLTLENIFGCSVNYDYSLYVYWTTETIDQSNLDEVILFPNPANNEITLNINSALSLEDQWNIFIHDVNGKMIPDLKINAINENNFLLDVSDLPSGVYLISMSNMNFIYTSKFVVNR